MINLSHTEHPFHCVENFQELVSTPYHGATNAICWNRKLPGDFAEIVNKVSLSENMAVLEQEELLELPLTEQGQIAREILLNDLKLLKAHGVSPTLNLIRCYERDDAYPFFPTDVYSFHVDRSPVPTDTFLCTYYGDPSEIIPNSQAVQKILIPEIREELLIQFGGDVENFESYLTENFFDLHYQATPEAEPLSLGLGNLWRLAIDHPELRVPPCVHRAPKEKTSRLLLIC